MATDPGLGYRIRATTTNVKGECSAVHEVGESFELSCHNPAGLCGFIYHHIAAELGGYSKIMPCTWKTR
jgi:hypothetical protein